MLDWIAVKCDVNLVEAYHNANFQSVLLVEKVGKNGTGAQMEVV